MTTKICTKYGKEKDILDFHRHIRKPLGIRSDCKDCVKNILLKIKIEMLLIGENIHII